MREDGIQRSTLDYVLCSPSLMDSVHSMEIEPVQMGSDHRPLVVRLAIKPTAPEAPPLREAWRVHDGGFDQDWAGECRESCSQWLKDAASYTLALDAAAVDDTLMADVLEWSFQAAIDKVAAERLGVKKLGTAPAQSMSAAVRLLASQRAVAEDIMKAVVADCEASEEEKTRARRQFLRANRAVQAGVAKRRQVEELRLFHDIEDRQGDSKLFWAMYKKLQKRTGANKSPPHVARDPDGNVVTGLPEVLRVWREFSKAISSADLTGTKEEGIYDEDHKTEVEEKLRRLRGTLQHQDHLDRPITEPEVWSAIRELKLGKAPGVDGVLTDIIKHAADAVGKGRLGQGNTVVTAIATLFNFMFEREVWPDRWSRGVIFPIHKHDSRLDPGNYRPITLLSVMGKLFGSVINARLIAFSEAVGSICDEQGGFRPKRGAPDQVFLWREILASRKERRLPTVACFVDVRKAYDTVWREGAYVRIYEGGVRGKIWRQLQVMHAGTSRSVLHPAGLTDPFVDERGVPQGAVESPWIYSQFIEGLAKEIKSAGLGVWIAGRQVPLLMYADDIVFLAGSVSELRKMMAIASVFSCKNRFQFNGGKSGVMVMNAGPGLREQVHNEPWMLAGEHVEVKERYEYLGTLSTSKEASWGEHMDMVIGEAEKASAELLRVLRRDRGMRPRTGITLWKSLIRPKLEYACEIWNGQVSAARVARAEAVQLRFIRGMLGLHDKGSGVSNEVVRAEVGCESLQCRWDKLQLGYWQRIYHSPPNRLLRVVAEFRRREWVASAGRGLGGRGCMQHFNRLLLAAKLGSFWGQPSAAARLCKASWKKRVYTEVDRLHDDRRAQRMSTMSSAEVYVGMKEWGANEEKYSFSRGERGKLGHQVPERYLDDRVNLKGTRLKMLCRLGCLPLLDRVGREAKPKLQPEMAVCLVCSSGAVESIKHLVMDCPAYATRRHTLMQQVGRAADRAGVAFAALPPEEQFLLLLGKRVDDPVLENRVDWQVKKFLCKSWTKRKPVMDAINRQFGTQYVFITSQPRPNAYSRMIISFSWCS